MTLPIALSAAAQRTHPSSISHLMQTALENPGIVSLAAGFVDQQSLPVGAGGAIGRRDCWATRRRVAGRFSTERRSATCGFGRACSSTWNEATASPPGSYREALPRTIVTTGSAQLIYLVCEALLDPGDIVLVESPTYFVFLGPVETRARVRSGFRSTRAACGSSNSSETLARLESEGQLDRVKLIYTIPEHANPTGISLAASRRRPLVELARKWSKNHRIFVLEDAAYRGLGVRGKRAAVALEPRPRGRHGDPGPDVQQDAQPGAEDRLRGLARGTRRADRCA